ncbi:hypothetical protein [Azohydromonas aeria]|uniref:hypothetical protein n=1 Tax=Azohydromonas aeria TaxID=2590212 RepID=UPI001E5234A2|nr:hypothetical protein [Azohydromonas aeria]
MYVSHPSPQLQTLFSHHPFQGAAPEAADFLFVGLDANYAPDIERSPIFDSVVEYHRDGVAFWRQHGVHHPFLLPGYGGDGRRYHQNFSRIGFGPEQAHRVSFIELLHVPTVGRSQLTVDDLNPAHLERINRAILDGQARHTFLSAGVVRLMQASGRFPWLTLRPKPAGTLPVLHFRNGRSVYLHLHFSNYGKFQAQMNAEARVIASLLISAV